MLPVTGQMIKVRLSKQSDKTQFKSSVIGVDKLAFLITMPVGLTNPHLTLTPGEKIEVEYHGRDGAKMTFSTALVKVSYEPPQVELQTPKREDVRREQRRDFVRVPASLAVRMEPPLKSSVETRDVYMRDISGGGVAILVPGSVAGHAGNIVRIHFTLPKLNAHIDTACTIIRISEQNEAGFTVWSLMFNDMKESVRKSIVQYTFVRQRELQDLNRDMSRS
ncbi:flagellar brake protein [Alicyclobacillus sp. SO9]|uniref:flagellar brake protein n=1 Tax=Alicyclobacillus sp. SO9 TaxID=2665646 RepID=UPI0018E85F24|nr:PilZ domain-containing protein [Alicyclobacillus sp. SO9]QQE76832.1 PilZ domain-containing protein [Alicyclobacillus sp. SO9]